MSAPSAFDSLQARVTSARTTCGIPGLSVAAAWKGRTYSAAAGVLNIATGVEVTPDSLFQVGSITKALTATLIMAAQDEKRLDIDAPINRLLEARIGVGPYADQVTARQLMAHTSGLDGDLFEDTGRDDDALAKYMVLCRDLEFMAPPGAHYNYSNAGYSVLGRLVELAFGSVYDTALRDRLFARIGAERSTTFAEEAAFRRAAVGHFVDPEGKATLAPPIAMPRALGPAGLTLYSTAPELTAFATALMSGNALIERASAAAMMTPQIDLPENAQWGLGLKVIASGKTTFIGHEGGTVGQVACFWADPISGLAVAMCCNGGASGRAWREIAHPIFMEVCGAVPEVAVPAETRETRDLKLYEGSYGNLGLVIHVTARENELAAVAKQKYFGLPDTLFTMRPIGGDRFRVTLGDDDKVVMAFYDPDADGRPELMFAGRLHKRVRE